MLISILQDIFIKEKARFLDLVKDNRINIGTVIKVPPAIPQLSHLYHHFILIFEVHENRFQYVHLRKHIFFKNIEIVNVPFHEIERYINFKYGIYIHSSFSNEKVDKEGMEFRVYSMMNKNIPYGFKSKCCFNCETLVYYLILGKRIQSSEIERFEKKFSKIGTFLIFCFDKLMFITNFFGEMKYIIQTERKNNK